MKVNQKPRYALVLSGGGARGLVHVGVICALEEAGYPPPSLIAGTSMGAIIGGLYASGMKGPDLKRFVLEKLDIPGFMESPVFKMDGPMGKIFQTGQIIGNAATKPGIDSGARVLQLLEELSGGKKIESCGIPFLCNAVDLSAGKEVIFRTGSLARAIRASMSFPFIFEPLLEGDMCLVDGGVADNMPVKSAREAGRPLGIKKILAVDTRRWHNIPAISFRNGISVVMRCFEAMIHVSETEGSHGQSRSEAAEPPNLVLHAADKTSAFDFSRKKDLIILGEAAVHQSSAELESFFSTGLKSVLARRNRISCGIQTDTYYSGGYSA
jgi:NTE family protein